MPQIVEVPGVGQVEFPDSMSDDEIVAAIQRDILPKDQPPQMPTQANPFPQLAGVISPERDAERMRQAGLAGRAMVEGTADLASPFANPLAVVGNWLIEGAERFGLNQPGGFRFPEQSQAVSNALTDAGVPTPQGGQEQAVNTAGRVATTLAAGPRLDRAVTAMRPSAPTPPPAVTTAALANQFDVPLTAGERSGNPIIQRVEAYLERLPVIGIKGFRERQQAAVKGAAGRIVREAGDDVDNVGEAVRDSLNRVYDANRETAGRLFDRVDDMARGVSAKVPTTARQRVAQEILSAEANLARSGAADTSVTAAARAALEAPELTFAEARTLRSRLLADIRKAERGEVSGSVNRETVAALKRLEQALEQDMEAWAAAAGGRVLNTWRNANQYYRTRVVPFKDRTIRRAMADDFDTDTLIRTFIKPNARGTAGRLVDRLDLKGKEALRYGILRDAFDNALDKDGFFSPLKFRQAIDRLGKTNERVFTPRQRAQLDGFSRLAEAAKRAGQYKENPPTGQRLMDAALGGGGVAAYGAGGLPGVLAGAAGTKALSILLTTQRGRSILERASVYPVGSQQMNNVLRAAVIELDRMLKEEEQ